MSSRKRSRQSGLDAAELGVIKLADGGSIAADLLLARACSSCARGLPADAQEWDLSGIQIDGQPAERETVSAWLSCVDRLLHHAADSTDSSAALTTAKGLQKLLSFADAVGSIDGVLHACLAGLENLRFTAVLGGEELKLETDGRPYHWFKTPDGALELHDGFYGDETIVMQGVALQQKEEYVQEIAAQTAALLTAAHQLQLQPLIQRLHNLLFGCLAPIHDHFTGCAFFDGYTGVLFTGRLLDAALGSGTSSREQYLTNVLLRPCGLTSYPGSMQLLKPLLNTAKAVDGSPLVIKFEAELAAPLFGGAVGDPVDVTVDLFDTAEITLEGPDGSVARLPVTLAMGWCVSDVADLQQMFSPFSH